MRYGPYRPSWQAARLAKIQFFFTLPIVPQEDHIISGEGQMSTLYPLRKEIEDCLLEDRPDKFVDEKSINHSKDKSRLFSAVMVIFAGIDLLATLAEGDHTQVEGRFVKFLTRFVYRVGRKRDRQRKAI